MAIVATATMTCVADVRASETSVATPVAAPATHWSQKSLAALRLMRDDRRVLLLSMLNFTFGFSSAFVNTFITGVVIPRSLGADKVGYLVSIIPLTAALTAMPIAAMTERIGSKTPAMLLGGAAFACFFLPFFISAVSLNEKGCVASSGGGLDDEVEALTCAEEVLSATFGRWSALVPLLILNGAGRAVWYGIPSIASLHSIVGA